ncbi:type VI secretion system ImpA family N-terminal domain-containing protein [Enterobacteriaceae bacterium H18W14]|uniref:VasL domain-containing protein n=1 Tax=Dryocola boscaweniae TaxID=2925397 RepID=UPI0022EFEB92|nr:VasL domain-containing protein [Dryocola boscaweniae]MCT4715595.1 type VI secretion system ImpA family N-terminal domain-containing protein [Dryocola boscaweniae]
MKQEPELRLRAGGDPRTLPDYAALRDELSKLTHPARPDVNWSYAEKLCLSLFETNGVEMQTAAWYTLARTHLAGLYGLNEGLRILEALIASQWSSLWPQPVHARMEILNGLGKHLLHTMRSLTLTYADMDQLERAEQLLAHLGDGLQRLELGRLSQLDILRTLMHNTALRLQKSDNVAGSDNGMPQNIALPAGIADVPQIPLPGDRTFSEQTRQVYATPSEPQPDVEVVKGSPVSTKPWKSFAAGMCTMLLISGAAFLGWQYFFQPDPLQMQLAESLAPLPVTLTPVQQQALRRQSLPSETFITDTQQQLARLGQLSPGWNIDYARQLIEQAQTLWPEQAKPLALQWRQQLNAAAIPAEKLDGWRQGMMTLQQLSDRLNGLDEQKGKYMTVSELKSVVFATVQAFSHTIPAEEQLRLLAQTPSGQPLPVAARVQIETRLRQLIARYTLLTHAGIQIAPIQQKADY